MRLKLGAGGLFFVSIAAASCATGGGDSGGGSDPALITGDDGGAAGRTLDGAASVEEAGPGVDPCTGIKCAALQVCSAGACVPDTTDADKDGFDVRTDCNDHDPTVHPNATETCNDVDDNCNGTIDEGFDKDKDTYFLCAHGALGVDCDDDNAAVHPGATEVCNGIDDDCNANVDDGFDKDNDTYFQCAHGQIGIDCNDNDPAVHPGATEVCDGKDNDCDGKIDNLPARIPATGVDSFQPTPNAHWVVAGSASINTPNAGWTLLTPDSSSQAGALWWNASYTFDHFDVSFVFWIDAKSGGADGLTFAWVPGATVAVGGGGGGYGFYGLGGNAVVVDTYQNSGEPSVPFLAVVDSNNSHLTRAALPNVRDGQNHTMRVLLQSPNVSAWIDGVQYVNAFPIPNYAPFAGHWGFTAGTGNASEKHMVNSVAMSFPDGQGCVP